MSQDRLVAVCSSCLRACCLQRAFLCPTPGKRIRIPLRSAMVLDREHPDFWKPERECLAS
jgi:hypothetical protein